mmetsp:Transcript_37565/g.113481  ORF Transcript_37565/g.113481 Transcript_37565/m.113481 type:complete len:240 (+) Transcript_37565:63-782(+)
MCARRHMSISPPVPSALREAQFGTWTQMRGSTCLTAHRTRAGCREQPSPHRHRWGQCGRGGAVLERLEQRERRRGAVHRHHVPRTPDRRETNLPVFPLDRVTAQDLPACGQHAKGAPWPGHLKAKRLAGAAQAACGSPHAGSVAEKGHDDILNRGRRQTRCVCVPFIHQHAFPSFDRLLVHEPYERRVGGVSHANGVVETDEIVVRRDAQRCLRHAQVEPLPHGAAQTRSAQSCVAGAR